MTERPIECSHCTKPIKVIYKEIIGEEVSCTQMCADCPILNQRLYGKESTELSSEKPPPLFCGKCHTGLESLKTGNHLGCSGCYEVFGDLLINELASRHKLPPNLQKTIASRRNSPLHSGKSPGKPIEIPSTSQLTTLNEALNEALKKENYEQAAWLRDQIKALEENPDAKKE